MGKTVNDRIRFWSEIALGAVTLIVALVFIIEVADIYYSAGEVIYSRAIVWARLKKLIAPLVIWVVGAIACYVLSVIYPLTERKKSVTPPSERVRNLKKRIPVCDGEEFSACKKQFSAYEIGRLSMYAVAVAFSVAAAIIAIVYLADHSHFDSGAINVNILMLVKNVFPWIVAAFLLFIAIAVYDFCTAKKELKCLSRMLVLGKGKPVYLNPVSAKLESVKAIAAKNSAVTVWVARGVVFVVAVVFLGLGISNGGASDVLNKAINICTECIGLG